MKKKSILSLTLSAILSTCVMPMVYAGDLATPASDKAIAIVAKCNKLAQPSWDKGSRGDMYEGNENYRVCLKKEIGVLAKSVLGAQQGKFMTDMEKALDQLTQVYGDISEVTEAAGHRKAFDPTADASDLIVLEQILSGLTEAEEILKKKA